MRSTASRAPASSTALTALLVAVLAVPACEQFAPPSGADADRLRASRQSRGEANAELARVRRATAPYNDLRAATDDGYVQFSPHVPGMGIHYLTDSAIEPDNSSGLDGSLDRTRPEVLVYVDEGRRSGQRRLVAVEYAIPKDGEALPQEAVDLFSAAGEEDWHVHPSVHELPLPDTWTVHGECHYQGGIGVFLAENPDGDLVLWTPPTGAFGTWSGTVEPEQCPSSLGPNPLPPLLIAHGKWWTLHAWVWMPNPEGVFHPTNPRVSP